MKKILSITLLLTLMVVTAGAKDLRANVTIRLSNDASTTYQDLKLRLDLDDEYTSTSWLGNTSEMDAVNIYAVYTRSTGTQWSTCVAPDMTNLPIEVITSRVANQTYTLTFTVPAANNTEVLTLYDLATGQSKAITNGETYQFEVNTTLHPDYVAGTNYKVANRFVINYVPEYTMCYQYNKFEVTTPNIVVGNMLQIQILDSVDNATVVETINSIPCVAGTYTYDLVPAALEAGKKYRVVGLANDTLVFRYKPTPVTPAP